VRQHATWSRGSPSAVREPLDAAERQRSHPPQAAQEPPDAVVTNHGLVIADQILMNPLGPQPLRCGARSCRSSGPQSDCEPIRRCDQPRSCNVRMDCIVTEAGRQTPYFDRPVKPPRGPLTSRLAGRPRTLFSMPKSVYEPLRHCGWPFAQEPIVSVINNWLRPPDASAAEMATAGIRASRAT